MQVPHPGTCKMPDATKFGSPVVRNRLVETLIVLVVLVAAAVAYWFFHR